jgi:tetratricopeptide (TPR) repeat protein
LNANFILVRAENGTPRGTAIFRRFGVSGTPTELILGPDGAEVDWHVGYLPPPEKYVEKLKLSAAGTDTVKSLSEAVAKDPKNAAATFKLARKYDARYLRDKALELYRGFLALDAAGTSGTTDYRSATVTNKAFAEFSIGIISLTAGPRSVEPLKAYLKSAADGPLLRDAWRRLAGYYIYAGDKEDARRFYEDFIARFPEDTYAYDSWVNRIIQDGSKESADKGIDLIEKIRDLTIYAPDPNDLYQEMAALYMLKGDAGKALENYGDRFVTRQIGLATSNLVQYAQFWSNKNENIPGAVKAVELALKLEPDMPYVLQAAAGLYIKAGQESQALAVYGPEFAKKNWGTAGPLYGYSRFWLGQNLNLGRALEAARRMVEIEPLGAWFYWDTLAGLEAKAKNFGAAVKAGEKAVEVADEGTKPSMRKKLEQYKADAAKK